MRPNYSVNARKSDREAPKRVVVEVEPPLLAEIDDWGVGAGHESRSAALRRLIRSGLTAEKTASPQRKAG